MPYSFYYKSNFLWGSVSIESPQIIHATTAMKGLAILLLSAVAYYFLWDWSSQFGVVFFWIISGVMILSELVGSIMFLYGGVRTLIAFLANSTGSDLKFEVRFDSNDNAIWQSNNDKFWGPIKEHFIQAKDQNENLKKDYANNAVEVTEEAKSFSESISHALKKMNGILLKSTYIGIPITEDVKSHNKWIHFGDDKAIKKKIDSALYLVVSLSALQSEQELRDIVASSIAHLRSQSGDSQVQYFWSKLHFGLRHRNIAIMSGVIFLSGLISSLKYLKSGNLVIAASIFLGFGIYSKMFLNSAKDIELVRDIFRNPTNKISSAIPDREYESVRGAFNTFIVFAISGFGLLVGLKSDTVQCRLGNGSACLALAETAVFQKDEKLAGIHYRSACALGVKSSCSIGVLFGERHGELSLEEARSKLKSACSDGDLDGCYYLGGVLKKALSDPSAVDEDGKMQDFSWAMEKVCREAKKIGDSRFGETCIALGNLYAPVKGMSLMAYEFYDLGCKVGNSEGCDGKTKVLNDWEKTMCYPHMGFNWDRDEGFIKSVSSGSPAESAGLTVGDRVLTINGESFRQYRNFPFQSGVVSRVELNRAGVNLAVDIQIKDFCEVKPVL
jgi:hypothetical protein